MDHAQLLREIMQVYDSSLSYDDRLLAGATARFRQILEVMVDPAVAVCVAAAEKARPHHQWDSAVFILNCLCYLKVSGGQYRIRSCLNRLRYSMYSNLFLLQLKSKGKSRA